MISDRQPARWSGTTKIWALNIAMVATGSMLCVSVLRHVTGTDSPISIPWWALAISFALSETFVIHVETGNSSSSLSLSELSLLIGLFFVDPLTLVVAQAVGGFITLKFHRKQSTLRLAFNLSQMLLSTSFAALAFHTILRGGDALGPWGWGAAFAAAFLADSISSLAIQAAISFSENEPFRNPVKIDMNMGFVMATTCLALVSATILWERPNVAWLLPSLAASLYLGYRAFESLKRKHQTLHSLYELTELSDSHSGAESMVGKMMAQAKQMFRADIAEIILFAAEPGDSVITRTLGVDGDLSATEESELDPQQGVWARVAAENEALLLSRPISNPSLKAFFSERGVVEAMVSPLRRDGAVIGTFMVANRIGEFKTFDKDDLQMLETLANHASIALENGRLVETLRTEAARNQHQALHDELTGLPNRTLFNDRLTQAVQAATRAKKKVAVLLIDLDHFKDVNDSLGHHHGDLLLQEVGRRLRQALRDADTVARLGGDEFSVLLSEVTDEEGALATVEKLLKALNCPLELGDITVDVRGSIGIAMFPEHGREASTLLQRADVAMYLAKAANSGYEVYVKERDQSSASRLALVAELREAIQEGTLCVHYQPQVEIRTGRALGVEGLVRWMHPQRGSIPPDEFIPMAEQTGLIRPLTLFVLRTVLADLRGWVDNGFKLKAAVNLSARNLLDSELLAHIKDLLEENGVHPNLLQLEITESSIMADSTRGLEHLTRLNQMGIGLSIDDYGTGYSSLSYLKTLPVQELKIDKSFVFEMNGYNNDEVIVRSTIELAHNLGLRVVAEGVEEETVLTRLRSLGCDVAQGYHLGRPMPIDKLQEWLAVNYPIRSSEEEKRSTPSPALRTNTARDRLRQEDRFPTRD